MWKHTEQGNMEAKYPGSGGEKVSGKESDH